MTTIQPVPLPTTGRPSLSPRVLDLENQRFHGTAGVSLGNRPLGFRPAFLDQCSGAVHLSRFADGRPAPMHLLAGLPAELVARRTCTGQVAALKPSVVAGFVLDDRFYTRQQAADFAAATRAGSGPGRGGVDASRSPRLVWSGPTPRAPDDKRRRYS